MKLYFGVFSKCSFCLDFWEIGINGEGLGVCGSNLLPVSTRVVLPLLDLLTSSRVGVNLSLQYGDLVNLLEASEHAYYAKLLVKQSI